MGDDRDAQESIELGLADRSLPVYGDFGRWQETKLSGAKPLDAHDLISKLIFFDATLLVGYVSFVMAKAGCWLSPENLKSKGG